MVDRISHLPSLAALGVSAVLASVGYWLDGGQPGWLFGGFLVAGAVFATAAVRPVGLWAVVPAPPLLCVGLVVGVTAAGGKSLRELVVTAAPLVIRGFPPMAVAVGAGVAVAAVRLGGTWWQNRSSSTRPVDAGG
ncbi:DUF6542 domain-containing protein [Actinosynnema sp. NPDC047251]|uniref:Putative secreted protein n=1 Tax=Saccharothrix espanaensis (strain ATCC 51144 / DSM 44229 / JCM 9112 / NBRC 15066 / NRRL 15764) TaxID=1179773 RepID=K0JPK5_SACES|nr:DUF6542 domain-containing protein [Saccharothrix espanaensis]CCH28860.1 putative secreted protein [Saccharothrix espanaensis DSM 44229]